MFFLINTKINQIFQINYLRRMFFLINTKINQIFQINYLRGLEIAELKEEDMPTLLLPIQRT